MVNEGNMKMTLNYSIDNIWMLVVSLVQFLPVQVVSEIKVD